MRIRGARKKRNVFSRGDLQVVGFLKDMWNPII
jgi:hypothetical protein